LGRKDKRFLRNFILGTCVTWAQDLSRPAFVRKGRERFGVDRPRDERNVPIHQNLECGGLAKVFPCNDCDRLRVSGDLLGGNNYLPFSIGGSNRNFVDQHISTQLANTYKSYNDESNKQHQGLKGPDDNSDFSKPRDPSIRRFTLLVIRVLLSFSLGFLGILYLDDERLFLGPALIGLGLLLIVSGWFLLWANLDPASCSWLL
jgi:hypothetical protein